MKTDIYSAYGKKPLLKTVNYGVGDIVKVNSYGEVYPSYRDAYKVFGFDMDKKDQFDGNPKKERINMYRVVGFLLHEYGNCLGSYKSEEDYILTAISNDNEDLIISAGGVEPINCYNTKNAEKVDRVVISRVTDAANYCASVKTHTSQGS